MHRETDWQAVLRIGVDVVTYGNGDTITQTIKPQQKVHLVVTSDDTIFQADRQAVLNGEVQLQAEDASSTQAVYLYQGGDDGNEGQHNSDHQLDEDEGLDEDLLLRENHLHVGHGHVREGLDHNVTLRHALQPQRAMLGSKFRVLSEVWESKSKLAALQPV
ncbi:MAG: hypothetical protein FRX49_11229 [Trebouxia sp. A1-2]|nr:MAG: hypothetical protein FRX49_11229 [Trebouxia sp. A1-2]